MLYLIDHLIEGGKRKLHRVSRLLVNDRLEDALEGSRDLAATLLFEGHVHVFRGDGEHQLSIRHTLPAEDLAQAEGPFDLRLEQVDGSLSRLTVTPSTQGK
jgi:hypothetical protein